MTIIVDELPTNPYECLFAKTSDQYFENVLPKCSFKMNASVLGEFDYWSTDPNDMYVCDLCKERECEYLKVL